MPRSLLLSDRCEYFDERNDVCGRQAFSMSVEHNDIVLCRKHYESWQQQRKVQAASSLIQGLTAEEKKALIKSLGA